MATPSLEHALIRGYELSHYRIDHAIGGGGFSMVYLADDLERSRKVIIKEFLPMDRARRLDDASVEYVSHDSGDPAASGIKRFFDEAAALSKLNHPYIVKVRDVFRANNTVYMVMEYQKGKDLRWYVKKQNGRLSEKFIMTVFPRVLEGLQELHINRLLHLDIKPANIFIRHGGKPLLLDFGAARESMISRLRTGPNTLTMGYAPIEQHRNGHIGPWTDMYAVGATMWACMDGKPPPSATERAVKDAMKPAVKRFKGKYSNRMLDAVDWCLQMDQTQRPQNVEALLDLLNQDWIDEGEPGLAQKLRLKLPW